MALFHYFDVVTNTRGDSLVGYQVAVRLNSGVVPLYADANGTPIASVSGLANVALTDAAGNFSIYVDPGTYDLEIRTPAGVFLKSVTNVPMTGGPTGQAGSDAGTPISYRETAVAGQTAFPREEADFSTVIRTDGGTGFNYLPATVAVFVNGTLRARDVQYVAPGNFGKILFLSPLNAGDRVEFYGYVSAGAGGSGGSVGADEVDVASYPGTTVEADPNRLDHDNMRFKNAQLDVTDPTSDNFRKALRFFPGAGSGQLVLTKPGGGSVPQLTAANDPADPEMNAKVGDWLLDSWSQNGIVPDNFPTSPIIDNKNDPGNWLSGVVIRASYQTRFRRPPRVTMRPFILCCDPVATPATTVGGIDTQSDVFVGNRIEGFPAFIGENHWRGYSQHANDIQVNAVTDFYCEARGYGQRSDLLYIGAGSVGGGAYNRHNKRVQYHCIADGYNRNNRNVVSTIDVDGEVGVIWARRFSKFGGPAANDDMDPNTGVGAPGVHDAEPNASFTDNPIYRNSDVTIYAEDCGSPGAIFLPENGSFPNPCQNIKRRVTHYRCAHGFISQTKANPTVPYGIDVEIWCDKSDRPLEVLSGGGSFKVHATDCPKAVFVGYFSLTAGDLNLSGELIRCGTASGVTIENRGWDGGSAKGLRILGAANVIGIRHIPVTGQLTRGITFDGVEFGTGMAFGHYVDVGADVRAGTLIERNARYNGVSNFRWNAPGTPLKSIPTEGAFTAGQEWPGIASGEPGAPRIIRAIATNATGTSPRMIVQEQIGGFADPVSTVNLETFRPVTNARIAPTGRITAIVPTARFLLGPVQQGTITGRAPFNGSQGVYIGFHQSTAASDQVNPTSINQMLFGIWFGDTTSGVGMARAVANGGPVSGPFPYSYGDVFSVAAQANNSATITLNGQTIATTGLGAGALYGLGLFTVSGEGILITGVPA